MKLSNSWNGTSDLFDPYCGANFDWVPPIGYTPTPGGPTNQKSHYGFWNIELTNVLTDDTYCHSWDKIQACYEADDTSLKVGRAVSVIGAVLSILIFFFLIFATFMTYPQCLLRFVGVVMAVLSMASLVFFVGISTDICDHEDFNCSYGTTAWFAIPSCIFWAAAAIATLFFMDERERDSERQQFDKEPLPPPPESPQFVTDTAAATEAPVPTAPVLSVYGVAPTATLIGFEEEEPKVSWNQACGTQKYGSRKMVMMNKNEKDGVSCIIISCILALEREGSCSLLAWISDESLAVVNYVLSARVGRHWTKDVNT